ncbi:hypothetical protein T492DRAFT_1059708 [Pavlovales sp. CCMP2436]|nr:hypothetical protein T492DRAFT_1059708 [Pavlovales sp. CCMP2436]
MDDPPLEAIVLLLDLVVVVALLIRVMATNATRCEAAPLRGEGGQQLPWSRALAPSDSKCMAPSAVGDEGAFAPSLDVLEAAALLGGLGLPRGGFELVLEQTGLRFLRKPLSSSANQFLTEGIAECTDAEFLELWTDATFRHEWDAGLASLAPVAGGGGALCHVVKYPYPLSNRHYLYDRSVHALPNGTTVIICATAAPRLAQCGLERVPGSVLCAHFHSLTAMRPARDGSGRCEYAMLTLDQQPLPLPGFLLDLLLNRTYPAYMASVQDAVRRIAGRRLPASAAVQPPARPVAPPPAARSDVPSTRDAACSPRPPVPARARTRALTARQAC